MPPFTEAYDRAENIDIRFQSNTTDKMDLTCLTELLTSLVGNNAINFGNGDLNSLNYLLYKRRYWQISHDNLTNVTIL